MSNTTDTVQLRASKHEFHAHLERQLKGLSEEFMRYSTMIDRMEKYDKQDQQELEETRTTQRELFYGIVVNTLAFHNIEVAWQHVEKHAVAD